MRRTHARPLMVAYLAILFGLTLGGFYQPRAPVNVMPLRTIVYDLQAGGRDLVINLLGNIVAFVPVGLLLPPLIGGRRPALRVAQAGFGISLVIEALQGASGRRVADIDDVILNTIGGLVGYGLLAGYRLIGRSRRMRRAPQTTFGPSLPVDLPASRATQEA